MFVSPVSKTIFVPLWDSLSTVLIISSSVNTVVPLTPPGTCHLILFIFFYILSCLQFQILSHYFFFCKQYPKDYTSQGSFFQEWPDLSVLVNFSYFATMFKINSLREEEVLLDHGFKSDGPSWWRDMAAEAWDSWSHCICSEHTEREVHWCSARIPSFHFVLETLQNK